MAISKADWELMEKVAAYFESTRKVVDPKAKYRPKREDSRSVNDTAAHFSMTRSKALKCSSPWESIPPLFPRKPGSLEGKVCL